MEQAVQTVMIRDLFEYLHCELVMVGGYVGRREDRSYLVLRGRDLVMLGLCKNSELPELFIHLAHERRYSFLDLTEVVVIHFLTLGRTCAEQCSAGQQQVLALVSELFIN